MTLVNRNRICEVLPFLVVAWILFARNPTALLRAEFWAEDGVNFFKDAYELGWKSLWIPLGGYQNLIPRLIAFFSTLLPVLWAPYVYAGCSWIISTLCLGLFSHPRFATMVEDVKLRTLVCCIFALAPGSAEMTQIICGLHVVFTLAVLVWCLSERFTLMGWRALVFGILALSAPELPILSPLLIYLYRIRKNSSYISALVIIFTVLSWNAWMSSHINGHDYGLVWSAIVKVPEIVVSRWVLYTFLIPLLGPQFAREVFRGRFFVFHLPAVLSVMSAAWLFVKMKTSKDRIVRFLLLTLAGAGTFGLVYVTRPYMSGELPRIEAFTYWDSRYGFIAVTFSILAWVLILVPLRHSSRKNVRVGASLMLALVLGRVVVNPSWAEFRPDLHWPKSAENIEAAETVPRGAHENNKTITVPIRIQPHAYAEFALEVRPRVR